MTTLGGARKRGHMAARKRTPKSTPDGSQPQLGAPTEAAVGSGGFSIVTGERVRYWKQTRYNPIRDITPEILVRRIDDFNAGIVRHFAQTMDAIEKRDDVLQCVIPKRKAQAKRLQWEVIVDPDAKDSPEAEAQKDVLKKFYKNIRVTNAVDMNQKGGFSLLVEQMMDAVAKRYAVHEIIFQPKAEYLTARFNFVPLWFFENQTGKLRFLRNDNDYQGVDLSEDGWMVTVGQGVMEACAVAWMFKNLGMKDWLLYCEKHGMPGVQGKTKAPKGSDQWNNLVEAVNAIAADFSCVTNAEDMIEKLDFSAQGQLPYPPLVERMDRVLAALWRGADLSTMSSGASGEGNGASLQGKEEHALQNDDAALVSETLNNFVDLQVLRYHFGDDVVPMAYVKVVVPPLFDVEKEIKVDNHLMTHGCDLGKNAMYERYGREMPDEDEEVAEQLQPEPAGGGGFGRGQFAANERTPEVTRELVANAFKTMTKAEAEVLKPLRVRLQACLDMPNEQSFYVAVANLKQDLPNIMHEINRNPAGEAALRKAVAAGMFNGMARGAVSRHPVSKRLAKRV